MDRVGELTIRGVHFEHEYGKTVESHVGTPGVEISLGDRRIFIGQWEASLIAKTIGGLGTSGQNSLTVLCYGAADADD
jgi:hypothetical protein